MINASCANCGRIVAFRSDDPTEEVECRGCGTLLHRSEGMLGVAVPIQPLDKTSHQQPQGPTLAPAKMEPVGTETRSSNVPAGKISQKRELSLLTSKVYIALEEIKAAMKVLEEGQQTLLDRTESISIEAPLHPLEPDPLPEQTENSFPTTAFSSREIQVVPHNLDELEHGGRKVVGERKFEPVPSVSKLLQVPAGTVIHPAPPSPEIAFPHEDLTTPTPQEATGQTAPESTPPEVVPFIEPDSEELEDDFTHVVPYWKKRPVDTPRSLPLKKRKTLLRTTRIRTSWKNSPNPYSNLRRKWSLPSAPS